MAFSEKCSKETKERLANFKTVDLFCGCGGMSLGFQNAGFTVVAAYDNWRLAVENYRLNFDHPVFERDLKQTTDLSDICDFDPGIIVGGPPCQDFSGAGHRDEGLGRADLTISYAEVIEYTKPNFFIMENVPRIQKSQILKDINKLFKSLGYGLTQVVLDASLCGVPQRRKRFFLVGGIACEDDFLLGELMEGLAQKGMTVHDYLGDSLGFENYFRVPRSYTRRGVFSIHEPAMTVRGVDRPVPKGYPAHPRDSAPISDSIRTLSYKERSLLQTFPPEFRFEGSKTTLNQLIGNAVPVKLAEYVANALRSFIEKNRHDVQIG